MRALRLRSAVLCANSVQAENARLAAALRIAATACISRLLPSAFLSAWPCIAAKAARSFALRAYAAAAASLPCFACLRWTFHARASNPCSTESRGKL